MIQGYAIPNATILGNNGAYKSEFYKALEGAKAAGATVEEAPCLLARGVETYNDGLPSTPSLLIVPQFYKAGNLYQDVPPFVAEDTTMRFTVSRNTTATRVNSSGLIESVASGVPRIDWLGQSCPGLLVEASGQNLCLQSENFGTTWATTNLLDFGSGSVLNTTATLDPYGNNSADLIVATTGNVQHRINQTTSSVSGSYTFSVFVKAAGYNFAWLRINTIGAYFDLSNGVISNVSPGIVASSQAFGNGWYRCIISKAISVANETVRINIIKDDGITDFAGDGTSGIYVFGAQYEVGSIATTYIPTTSGAVSRAADVISASGALVSGLIGQAEGVLYCEFAYFGRPAIQSGPIFLRQANLRGLSIGTAGVTNINFTSRNDGGASSIAIVTGSLQLNTYYKVAIAYDAGGTAAGGSQASGVVAYVNGVQTAIGTFRVPDAAGLTEFRMYGAPASSADNDPFNGHIRAAALYTTRLSNDQLAELTRL